MTTATAAKKIADAYHKYEVATTICDAAERFWDCNPESESAESMFDAAYRIQHERFEELVDVVTEICAPFVPGFDAKAARAMILKNNDRIAELIARLAA